MFGSGILEVAIGMIFVFLVMSLIITAASEFISSRLKWRAQNLEDGIRNLLHPRSSKTDTLLNDLTEKIYDHPLINSLSKPGEKPSYIPSRTFAVSLIATIEDLNEKAPKARDDLKAFIAMIPDETLKKSLALLSEEAENNLEKLKESIEVWFNNTMDRVSGWYKRKTQVVNIVLGVIFALALNVDAFLIARTLANDSALRAALVAQSEALAKENPQETKGSPEQQIQSRISQLGNLGLPIGWADAEVAGERRWPGWLPGQIMIADKDASGNAMQTTHASTGGEWWAMWKNTVRYHFIGWLLTGLAASLGAPFWFDLLNRFINLRTSGKAPEEKPKKPKEVPQPMGPGETAEEQRQKIDEAVKKD